MKPQSKNCFIVMPFRPELNFLYLYLQNYLESKHGLHVERGDHRISTKPLIEKVRDQILAAEIIIGDIPGKNPNVFYELGLAHAYGKPVILITQDPPLEAPVDVRHLEYVVYDLAKHEEFLINIDNAIQNVFFERYRLLYVHACDLLIALNKETGSSFTKASAEEFQARVMQGENIQGLPREEDYYSYAAFLLPRILEDAADINVMSKVTSWLSSLRSTTNIARQ